MIRQLHRRLQALEQQVDREEPELPRSHQMRKALRFLLDYTAKPGLERVHDYLKGPEAWVSAYVASGQIGAFVEYQCSCTLNYMHGPPRGYAKTEGTSDNPIVLALRAVDGLEEKLRECHQIDRWKTPELCSSEIIVREDEA